MAEVDAPSVAFVYRISPEDEWAAAQAAGALQGGQLDSTSGYIHLSTAAQVIYCSFARALIGGALS